MTQFDDRSDAEESLETSRPNAPEPNLTNGFQGSEPKQNFNPGAYPQGGAGYVIPPNPYLVYGAPPQYTNAPSTPVAKAQPSRAWVVALTAVILLFLLLFVGMFSCTAMMSDSLGSMPWSASSSDIATRESVGVIPISGTIDYNGTTSSPEGLRSQLNKAEQDPLIKAVVLRVNSGGGAATAGEEMAAYVRNFSKPIVVSSASMNASAAYEISSQADYIFTAQTTAIGGIGTLMQLTDYSGLLDQLGISIDNITSADSKDSSYGTRPLTEEERAYYQAMVNQINDMFISTVASGRSMSIDEVRALANGLTYTGIDAVNNGLADEIGLLEDAIEKAADLAGIEDPDVIYLRVSDSSISSIIDILGENSEEVGADATGSRALQ